MPESVDSPTRKCCVSLNYRHGNPSCIAALKFLFSRTLSLAYLVWETVTSGDCGGKKWRGAHQKTWEDMCAAMGPVLTASTLNLICTFSPMDMPWKLSLILLFLLWHLIEKAVYFAKMLPPYSRIESLSDGPCGDKEWWQVATGITNCELGTDLLLEQLEFITRQ